MLSVGFRGPTRPGWVWLRVAEDRAAGLRNNFLWMEPPENPWFARSRRAHPGARTSTTAFRAHEDPIGVVAVTSPQRHPDDDQRGADGEEADVPPQRVGDVVAYVVDGEEVVIDDAFDQVEDPPPGEEQADHAAPGRPVPRRQRAPQREDADRDKDPGAEMEQAVPQGVVLERADAGDPGR